VAIGTGASWDGKPVTVCSDTCKKARDGVCDEGRWPREAAPGSQFRLAVGCDLGTDCADCGPWVGAPVDGSWPEGGPIAHLVSKEVPLFTRRTVTRPQMQMVYTDPRNDLDVSAAIDRDLMLESGITAVFRAVLKDKCVDPATGKRRLVLDVGANFGYFSAYAARLGCRVIAWEPIPHFRAVTQAVLALNNVTHLVTLRNRVVTDKAGEHITMEAPTKGIWGTASVSGINQNEMHKAQPFTVTSERVDSVVDEDVLLMKVDVEGFESVVLNSAAALFSKRDVRNVVLEYNAGIAERMPMWRPQFSHLIEANPAMLMQLIVRGYRVVMMNDNVAKGGSPWHEGLPQLPEVTLDNLRYDLQDAIAFKAGAEAFRLDKPEAGLGCPTPPKLRAINPGQWGGCNLMPEDAHPKSLRSSFPANTNLWASKDHAALKADGVVGAFTQEQDTSKEWVGRTREPEFGQGRRACQYLPHNMLVRNRCNCSYSAFQKHTKQQQQACKLEEEAVMEALLTGQLKYSDLSHMKGSGLVGILPQKGAQK